MRFVLLRMCTVMHYIIHCFYNNVCVLCVAYCIRMLMYNAHVYCISINVYLLIKTP
jgi:hypothetical protein